MEPQWGCFERDQALALQRLGHEVAILYVDGRYRKYWRKIGITRFEENSLSIFGFYLFPKQWLRRISYKFDFKVSEWMIEKVFLELVKSKGVPDILYAHYMNNIAVASYLKKKHGIPLVGMEHWSVLTQATLSPRLLYIGGVAYNNVDKLLVVSHSLQSHIKRHFAKDSTVVYDMLGQEFITPKVMKRKVGDEFFFLAMGSLIHRKGYDILISAFAKSNLALKGCRVVIVGDGPEKTRLKKQANELGLSEYVSLVGRKNKEEIIGIMSGSHAFVLSSRAETFGVVCIEALSQGLPNIATVCGGPEEFISDKNGLLIPTDDIEAMAEAMIKMYENYSQYDKPAIANECLSNFSPQVVASQLTEIFNEVTK